MNYPSVLSSFGAATQPSVRLRLQHLSPVRLHSTMRPHSQMKWPRKRDMGSPEPHTGDEDDIANLDDIEEVEDTGSPWNHQIDFPSSPIWGSSRPLSALPRRRRPPSSIRPRSALGPAADFSSVDVSWNTMKMKGNDHSQKECITEDVSTVNSIGSVATSLLWSRKLREPDYVERNTVVGVPNSRKPKKFVMPEAAKTVVCAGTSRVCVAERMAPDDISVRAFLNCDEPVVDLNLEGRSVIKDDVLRLIGSSAPTLVFLNLEGCVHLSTQSLKEISRGCPNVRKLNINECTMISDVAIKAVVANMRNLEELRTRRCHQLFGAGFADAYNLKQLRAIDFSFCTMMRDVALFGLAGCQLEKIDFSGCKSITSRGLTAVLAELQSLGYLSLRACGQSSLNPLPVASLSQSGSLLTSLVLGELPDLSDDIISSILESAKSLQRLDLSGCILLTDASLQKISQCCTMLEFLVISGCPLMGKDGDIVRGMLKSNKALSSLNVTGSGMDSDLYMEVSEHYKKCYIIKDDFVPHVYQPYIPRAPKAQGKKDKKGKKGGKKKGKKGKGKKKKKR